jgi:hypothetical protein
VAGRGVATRRAAKRSPSSATCSSVAFQRRSSVPATN